MRELSQVVINMIKREIKETGLAQEKDPEKIDIKYDQIIQLVRNFYNYISEREISNLIDKCLGEEKKESKKEGKDKSIRSHSQKDPIWIAQSRGNIDKVILEEIILKGKTIEDFKIRFKSKGDLSLLLHDIKSRLDEYIKVLENLNLGRYQNKKEEVQSIINFAMGSNKQRLEIKKLYVREVLGNLRICDKGKFYKIVNNHFDGQNYVAAYVMASEGVRFKGNESIDKKQYDKSMDSVKSAFDLLRNVLKEEKRR